MRAFERREIMRHKCQICGCRNKIYTIIPCCQAPDGKLGFVMTCCNCGNEIYRHNFGDEDNLLLDELFEKYPNTLSFCAMMHTCPRRANCPYRKFDLVHFFIEHFKQRDYAKSHPNMGPVTTKCKKSNSVKLVINTKRSDKFR